MQIEITVVFIDKSEKVENARVCIP